LAEAFIEGRLTTDVELFDSLDSEDSEAVQAYKMLQALVKLAQNQIVTKARLNRHGQTLEDYGRRLETIEADLHQPNRTITEAQATQISQSVISAINRTKRPIVTNLALYGASFTGNLA
jgi:ferritin-like metal-binding protein YciE